MSEKKRRKSGKDGGLSAAEKHAILTGAREDAKEEFEREREGILAKIPKHVKQMFGQMGFAKFGKQVYGVLILNPFDVPPGPARNEWLAVFEKLDKQDRLAALSYMVYWYGTINPSDYYGFIGQKEFTPYEKGKSGAHYKAFEAAQRKQEKGKSLNKQEKERIFALEEIEEDLLKEPHERKRGVIDFQEGYDLITMADLDDTDLYPASAVDAPGSVSDSDHDKEGTSDSGLADSDGVDGVVKRKKKKKRGRPKKERAEIDDEVEGFEQNDLDDEPPKKKKKAGRPKKVRVENDSEDEAAAQVDHDREMEIPKKKKKKRGRPPKTQDLDDEGVDDSTEEREPEFQDSPLEDNDQVMIALKKKKGKKSKKHERTVKPMKNKAPPASEDVAAETGGMSESHAKSGMEATDVGMDDLGDEDVSEEHKDGKQGDDDKDEDFDEKQKDFYARDDDENFDEETEGGTKSKKKGRPSKKKPGVEADQKVSSKKKETSEFRRCENMYLDQIFEYEAALTSKDIVATGTSIEKVLKIVADLTVPFMQSYLVGLVKDTKQFIKSQPDALDELSGRLKLLKKTLNECYTAKNPLVPTGYKPPERQFRSISMDENKHLSISKPIVKKEMLKDAFEPEAADPRRSPVGSQKTSIPRKDGQPPMLKKENSSGRLPTLAPPNEPKSEPKRKTFSLGGLGRLMQKDQSRETSKQVSSSTASKPPLWLTGPATDGIPSGETRSSGLEFMRDMASHFPSGKVNIEATALAFEKAIYDYAQQRPDNRSKKIYNESSLPEDCKWEDVYWERVHAIVASICGRKESGTLMQLILNGEYAVPSKVVGLDEKQLRRSFDGMPLEMS